MTILLLLVGFGMIILGANWLVEGASAIARKAGVSEFVIGLTIVGFGTSCPELVVSLTDFSCRNDSGQQEEGYSHDFGRIHNACGIGNEPYPMGDGTE